MKFNGTFVKMTIDLAVKYDWRALEMRGRIGASPIDRVHQWQRQQRSAINSSSPLTKHTRCSQRRNITRKFSCSGRPIKQAEGPSEPSASKRPTGRFILARIIYIFKSSSFFYCKCDKFIMNSFYSIISITQFYICVD